MTRTIAVEILGDDTLVGTYDFSDDVGLGYTLATERLFCDFPRFQRWAEHLLDRPILTHEFASKELWAELREAFEASVSD